MAGDLLALGVLVAFALLAGRAVAWLRVPRVTGYLLAGALLGPSVGHHLGVPTLLSDESVVRLQPLAHVALALIVFSVGGHFRLAVLRRWAWRILALVAADALIPCAVVVVATRVAGADTSVALMLGIIAAATAPAATVMVIREYEADGELSHLILALLGMTNFVAIVGFQVVAHVVVTPDQPVSHLAFVLGAPLALGVGAGLLMSYWEERLERRAERQLMALAVLVACVGAAGVLGVSLLLTALVAGMVVVNASPHERRLFEDLQLIDYPFYVPFFALAGASLHIDLLPSMGWIGAAYVLARTVGKIAGNTLGARVGHFGPTAQRWLGLGMLAQAGVAVGFASQLSQTWGQNGKQVEALVLASVLVFEVTGPVLTRTSLVHGGEVTLVTLLSRRAPIGVFEGMHQVVEHFRGSLGIPTWHKLTRPGDMLVEHVMRRNVETVRDNLPFAKLLQVLGHSRYDRIPIVDGRGALVGQICYGEISSTLFEEALSDLVVARDLASTDPVTLRANDTLEVALHLFVEHSDVTYVPVVANDDDARLVGVVRQNDVLAACRKL